MRENRPERTTATTRLRPEHDKKSQPTPHSRHCHNPSSHRLRGGRTAPGTVFTHRPALASSRAMTTVSTRNIPPALSRRRISRHGNDTQRSLKRVTRCLTLSLAAPPGSYRHKATLSPTLADANYSGFCIRIELSLFYMPATGLRDSAGFIRRIGRPSPSTAAADHVTYPLPPRHSPPEADIACHALRKRYLGKYRYHIAA